MDGRAIIEVLGVLLVAFVVCVVVPLFLLFLYIKYRGGNAEMHATIAALKSGKVSELLPWENTSLGELTREWVGHATYTTSMFGRSDQAAGHVSSSRAPAGWLLAFSIETKNDGADGKVLAMTSAHRLEVTITGGLCHATLNGAVLGTFRMGEAAFSAPDGTALGTFGDQLVVRGRTVATIGAPRAGTPALTPLITNLRAERTQEDEAWMLVFAVFKLAQASVE
ncbi:MAG: hypothetical protein Q8N23_03455 [Archangium sp.]|nr:hypothetical protein [Archangium sp.]MDP3151701.1 hypothetical protein [Archangium sp.]MDP3573219.1 hypothetical protein [Archangium sp.]